jgi:membrane protein implicated in regulation of membrane protease activity
MDMLSVLDWVFIAALGLGALLGMGTLFGGGAEAADATADTGVDLVVDADAELGTDIETGPDAGAEGTAGSAVGAASPVEACWSALGIGRVPLGLLLTINLFLFGGIGLVTSELVGALLPASLASFAALPVAFFGAPFLGARLVGVVARNLPALETYGATPDDLVGRLGHVELRIDERFGRAKVVDEGGALHIVRCTTTGPALERGAEIVLTERDPLTGAYCAETSDFAGESRPRLTRLD